MTQQLLFILRQSPDWHGLAADYKQGLKIDPARFRPTEHIPGFPPKIENLIEQWNAQMGVDFFSCRARLKDICLESIARIPNARRISYLDVASIGSEIENYIAFFHDDDDWFAPDIGKMLQETLPEKYDVCVFPLLRLGTLTYTYRRLLGRTPDVPRVVIGAARPLSLRYMSNNYGLNGKSCDSELLAGMKDHVYASEYANTHGLRDVYTDRIMSATAKTPCSAGELVNVVSDPAKVKDRVRAYVAALEAVKIPEDMPWIADGLRKLVGLFSEALGVAPVAPAAQAVAKGPAAAPLRPGAIARPAMGNNVAALGPRPLVQRHTGIRYVEFIKFLAQQKAPSSYLEVGTRNGESVAQVDCDAICVDPNFNLNQDVVKKRQLSLLFQMTSDKFFADYDVRHFFPNGIDLAFLDGLHLFEFLLRDFMNTEKYCDKDSVILMHDCLPFSPDITGRVQRIGAWTGDVWKVLPILKRYRPDVKVVFFDCPPTGLVACTNLDPKSSVLADAYDEIMAEYSDITELPADLRTMYPRGDTRALIANPEELGNILPLPTAGARSAPSGVLAAGKG